MLSVFDKGPFPPCPGPFNMAAHVLAAGLRSPKKEALLIVSPGSATTWSFAELRSAVLGTATGLLDCGLAPGEIVLMRLGNTVDFPIAYLGALAAGLVPVPTSSALTEPETAFIIETVSPAAVLRAADISCPDFPRTIELDTLRGFRVLPPASFDMGDPDRLGYIIFTSGTAGKPRAVAHAHRAIWARQMMFNDWYGLCAEDRMLHAGAFNWTYTMGTGLMDPWTVSATAIIPEPGVRSEHLPALLAEHEATIFAAAPGVYRQILNHHEKLKLPRLRHGLSAGEKLPTATAARWYNATGRHIFEAFGMSECSTFISQPPKGMPDATSLGRPQQGRRIAILKDGVPVPVGTEGTIAIDRRDPGLMLEYLNAPEATEARLCGDWFLTGDQAIMQSDGAITYMGRDDDMMNAGGYRVSPVEVETALAGFPGIRAVAAAALMVKEDAEVIAAFYTGPAALDEQELRTYVSQTLARYKQPRLFFNVPELPVGANGKILRRVLRSRFERPQ